jgi:hypothetical protein
MRLLVDATVTMQLSPYVHSTFSSLFRFIAFLFLRVVCGIRFVWSRLNYAFVGSSQMGKVCPTPSLRRIIDIIMVRFYNI